jgi:uncharacterized peroxidase-related enzyme
VARLQPVNHSESTGATREMLDGIKTKLGMVPNLMRTFAHSPATLQFFLSGSQALAGGVLSPKVREQIDLRVSQINGCDYCLAAHTMLAKSLKLYEGQILDARRGKSEDPKTNAILALAGTLVEERGHLSNEDFARARLAGLSDAEISETIAAVALKTFTNYFAVASQVELDFPKVEALNA